MGSLVMVQIAFVLPPLFYWLTLRRKNENVGLIFQMWLFAIVLFGVTMMVLGCTAAVYRIQESYDTYGQPFACLLDKPTDCGHKS